MIGQTISRYRIVSKLGEGGMGTVWKAQDTLLGRAVALKFLPEASASSPEARRRFLREAQAASLLSHPGIATVYDAGEADGRVYIALLYVDGETVADRVRPGPLSVREAVEIAAGAAEALEYAHSHGVLHRDVSGRNVMVGRDGRVVVVDFGLALPEGQTRLTMTGATMGTAAYMAPEVVQGKEADRRSDVYSLGVVLYEMLTGGLPFRGESLGALLYATVHRETEAPGRRRVGIPEELDRVVLRVLEKDPGRRYQSAGELATELRSLAKVGALPEDPAQLPAGMPLSQAPTTPLPLAGSRRVWDVERREAEGLGEGIKRARRRWGLLILSACAVLGTGTAVALWLSGRLSGMGLTPGMSFASVAVLPLQNMSADRSESDYLAAGISQALITQLTRALDVRVTPWITASRYADTKESLPKVAKELNVDALLVGTLNRSGGRITGTVALVDAKNGLQFWADEFDEEFSDLFTVQRRIALGAATRLKGKLTGTEEQALAQPGSQSVDAYDFYLRGASLVQAGDRESADKALAFFERAVATDPRLEGAYVGIGSVHQDRYFLGWSGIASLKLAESNYQTALRIKPLLPEALRGLVRVAWEKGKCEDSLKIGKIAAASGREDVDMLLVRGEAYVLGGFPEKAVPIYERVIELDPVNPAAQWFLTIAHAWAGEFEETIEVADEYLYRFGEDPEVLTWKADASCVLGQYEMATKDYERALKIFDVRGNSNVYVNSLAGNCFNHHGDLEKARRVWTQGVKFAQERLALAPDNPRMRAFLATMWGFLGDREKFTHDEDAFLEEVERTGLYANNLAYSPAAHVRLGDTRGAVKVLRTMLAAGGLQGARVNFISTGHGLGADLIEQDPEYVEFKKEVLNLTDRIAAQY